MTLYFGLEYDERVYDAQLRPQGHCHLGPKGLLELLESYCGTQAPPGENSLIRIEQYRQVIKEVLRKTESSPFYQAAFEADELATAAQLLSMRDDLLLAGWDGNALAEDAPERLRALSQIAVHDPSRVSAGLADRWVTVWDVLHEIELPIDTLYCNEPAHLLPSHFKKTLDILSQKGIDIIYSEIAEAGADTDIARFRHCLLPTEKENTKKKKEKAVLQKDGSLVIIRAKRETEAAEFIAQWFRLNPTLRPLCLIPEKNRALDHAMIQEGLPSMGILSASLGRPSLQILRLVTAFLWEPLDLYKILEFLSLPLKPIDDGLAKVLGRLISESPGIKSEVWFARLNEYYQEMEERAKTDTSIDVDEIKKQYHQWFNRKRYQVEGGEITVDEAKEVFIQIRDWAKKEYKDSAGKNSSLQVLGEQAKKIVELLDELPETESKLAYLDLERIVRTVYEPAPVLFREAEVGHCDYIYHNSAIFGSVDSLLWWNFTDHERDYFFSKWYPNEWAYFEAKNWAVSRPFQLNELALWQRNNPIRKTQNRLILVIPEKVGGQEASPHSLEGDLKAAFANLDEVTYVVGTDKGADFLGKWSTLPNRVLLSERSISRPKPFLHIPKSSFLSAREEETFTSLDSLFYYPYKWLFKYKIDLHKSSILSVVKENRLKGNLAHRFFERMLKNEWIQEWKQADVETWIDQEAKKLLPREGAILLMYGKQPEKVAFLNKVKQAAWRLVSLIQNNGWKVMQTEKSLEGKFMGKPVKGKADLVLEREDELAVIDLKWGGQSYRMDMIKNKEDLQLVMYARLLTQDHSWAHTAYFIISKGEMLARNDLAFQEAIAADPHADHIAINEEIWNKMEATYQWRMQQIQSGKVEVRTEATQLELEELYMNELMDFLEMKEGSATYDDYETLINLGL